MMTWTTENLQRYAGRDTDVLSSFPAELAMLPVICVVVAVTCCGVDIVCNKPVEVLVATYANGLHVLLGDILAVCIEVAQNHHVLKQTCCGRT